MKKILAVAMLIFVADGASAQAQSFVVGAACSSTGAVALSNVNPGQMLVCGTGATWILSQQFNSSGSVGIGTTAVNAGTVLDLSGATNSEILPVGTSTNRPATGVNGMVRYNSTLGQFEGFAAGAWGPLASSSSIGSGTIGGSGGLTVELQEGSAAAPSLTFYADTITGIYQPSSTSHNIAITAGGTEQLEIDDNGLITAETGNINVATTSKGYQIGGITELAVPSADTTYSLAIGNGVLVSDSATGGGSGSHNTGVGYQTLHANTTGSSNTAVGSGALASNTTGVLNDAFGVLALPANTTGNFNEAFGFTTLQNNTTGQANAGFGHAVLINTTTGSYNTAYGADALYANTTGSGNLGLGYQVGYTTLSTGSNNTLIGNFVDTPASNTSNFLNIGNTIFATSTNIGTVSSPAGNVGIKTTTPASTLSVNGGVAIGTTYAGTNAAASNNLIVQGSVGIGTASPNAGAALDMSANTNSAILPVGTSTNRPATGVNGMVRYNTTLGQFEGYAASAWGPLASSSSIGSGTIGGSGGLTVELQEGSAAAPSLTFYADTITGIYQPSSTSHNIAITAGGTEQLEIDDNGLITAETGNINVATTSKGYQIGGITELAVPSADTTYSLAIGNGVLVSDSATGGSSGTGNTGVGYQALHANTTGFQNTAVGSEALQSNTTGVQNDAFGIATLQSNTTGNHNKAFGQSALTSNTTGINNDAFGGSALYNTTTGSRNTAYGDAALHANTTGGNNLGLGYQVGSTTLSSGSNNILIGTSNAVDTPASNTSNFLNIGNTIFATSTNTGTVSSPAGYVGIGTSSPNSQLTLSQPLTTTNNGTVITLESTDQASGGSPVATIGWGSDPAWGANDAFMFTQDDPANGSTAEFVFTGGSGSSEIVFNDGSIDAYGTAPNYFNGAIGIGTASPNAGAALDMSANTNSAMLPVGTSTNRPATGVNGMVRYNSTLGQFEGYAASAWGPLASASNIGSGKIGASGGLTVELQEGSAAAPSLTFYADTITGIYQPSATSHNIAITAGGTEQLEIDDNGLITAEKGNINVATTSKGYQIGGITELALPSADTTYSIAVGNGVLVNDSNTGGGSGYYNTGVGYHALNANTTGYGNTAVGQIALQSNTTGNQNEAFGISALPSNTTGFNNEALGQAALYKNTTANNNVAVGNSTMFYNTTGSDNTAIGTGALYANTTGSNNLGLGYEVGLATLSTGSNNILIGTSSAVDTPASNTSNFLNIGNTIFATSTNTGTVSAPAGYVGIGTSAPSSQLQVGSTTINSPSTVAEFGASSAGAAVNVLSLTNSATSTVANEVDLSMHAAGTYSPTAQMRNIITNTAGPNTDLAFNVYGTGGLGERMRIQGSTGNVGIGTTSPGSPLTVSGTAGTYGTAMQIIGSGTNQVDVTPAANTWGLLLGADSSTTAASSYHGPSYAYVLNVQNAPLSLGTNNAVNMTIANSGYVGIGTASPTTNLDVYSTASGGGILADGSALTNIGLSSGGTSYAQLGAATTAGSWSNISAIGDTVLRAMAGNLVLASRSASGGIELTTGSSDTAKVTVLSGGNVGIGTTSPAATLDVSGSAYVRSYNAGSATTINWALSNEQYTSASCGAFSFSGMQDGGTYILAVEGTTSGTCTFSNSDSPTLTFLMPTNNGATTSGTLTLYHFIRMGTNVFVTWMPGYP